MSDIVVILITITKVLNCGPQPHLRPQYKTGSLGSVLTALMPTKKHSYATAKNVEFCPLILHKVTTFLAKRLAGIANLLLLILMVMMMSTVLALACVVFLHHCHELFFCLILTHQVV